MSHSFDEGNTFLCALADHNSRLLQQGDSPVPTTAVVLQAAPEGLVFFPMRSPTGAEPRPEHLQRFVMDLFDSFLPFFQAFCFSYPEAIPARDIPEHYRRLLVTNKITARALPDKYKTHQLKFISVLRPEWGEPFLQQASLPYTCTDGVYRARPGEITMAPRKPFRGTLEF